MKRVVLWALLGWAVALVVSPRDVMAWFRPKTA